MILVLTVAAFPALSFAAVDEPDTIRPEIDDDYWEWPKDESATMLLTHFYVLDEGGIDSVTVEEYDPSNMGTVFLLTPSIEKVNDNFWILTVEHTPGRAGRVKATDKSGNTMTYSLTAAEPGMDLPDLTLDKLILVNEKGEKIDLDNPIGADKIYIQLDFELPQ